jgi:hypothetical protein
VHISTSRWLNLCTVPEWEAPSQTQSETVTIRALTTRRARSGRPSSLNSRNSDGIIGQAPVFQYAVAPATPQDGRPAANSHLFLLEHYRAHSMARVSLLLQSWSKLWKGLEQTRATTITVLYTLLPMSKYLLYVFPDADHANSSCSRHAGPPSQTFDGCGFVHGHPCPQQPHASSSWSGAWLIRERVSRMLESRVSDPRTRHRHHYGPHLLRPRLRRTPAVPCERADDQVWLQGASHISHLS